MLPDTVQYIIIERKVHNDKGGGKREEKEPGRV
jgi:hypothetical protein